MLRANQDTSKLETYTGSTWENISTTEANVTSVSIAVSSGMTTSGSPITSSGTINIGLNNELLSLASPTSTGFLTRTGTGTYAQRSLTAGQGITISNPDGMSGNPTIRITGNYISSFSVISSYPGLTASGSPITTNTGSIYLILHSELQALSFLNSNGLVSRQNGAYGTVSISGENNVYVTNGTGAGGYDVKVGLNDNPVLTGTQGVKLPGGVTAQRPSTPSFGMLRANQDTSKLETYTGSTWENLTTDNSFKSDVIEPCTYATTTNLAAFYANGTSGVGATLTGSSNGALVIDGINVVLNDRILVKNQTSSSQNGIYKVNNAGSVSTIWSMMRATDYDTPSKIKIGVSINVSGGTSNILSSWRQISVVNTIGSSLILIFQVAGGLTGEIKMWGSATIPAGWRLCDGSSLSRVEFPGLFGVIGTSFGGTGSSFNLPDFRGVFPRGVNGNRTSPYNDPDATLRVSAYSGGASGNFVGSYQNHEIAVHGHTLSYNGEHNHTWNGYWTAASGSGNQCRSRNTLGGDPTDPATSISGQHSHTVGVTGGNETRPKNLYVNFIIKT